MLKRGPFFPSVVCAVVVSCLYFGHAGVSRGGGGRFLKRARELKLTLLAFRPSPVADCIIYLSDGSLFRGVPHRMRKIIGGVINEHTKEG